MPRWRDHLTLGECVHDDLVILVDPRPLRLPGGVLARRHMRSLGPLVFQVVVAFVAVAVLNREERMHVVERIAVNIRVLLSEEVEFNHVRHTWSETCSSSLS